MKVLVITGSPHKNGTSAHLVQSFIKGAEEAGHEVCRFDAAFRSVHPCIACDHCNKTGEGCVFKDDMEELNPMLFDADVVAFASPIYYYGMCSQIRTVIDRFYANDARLHKNKSAVLMLTMADDTDESAQGAIASYKGMINFLEWQDKGAVVGVNCMDVEALAKTDYEKQAYELGKSL